MRNPLRSESEAFRFLVIVIAGAVVIAGAAWINRWLGVAAAVVVVGGILWWLRQESEKPGGGPGKLESRSPTGTHRVLVLALPGTASVNVDRKATEIVVIVPALASKLEAATGAVDDRRAEAEQTALALTRRLSRPDVGVRGEVGADDPVLAVEDALRVFGADEIVVAGDAELLEKIRGRVAVPAGAG